MPRVPKQINENLNTVNTLNAIRNDVGGAYAENVPTAFAAGDIINGRGATAEQALARLQEIGQTILQFPAYTNAFCGQLINRIAFTLISSRLYRNPWAQLKRGYVELGETIEEIFVNLASPHQFDPEVAETEVFKREPPDVRAAFHPMNYQKFYKVTVSRQELKLAFISFDGLNNLIQKIIERAVTSANYDEFLMMKYLIAKSATLGRLATYTLPEPTKETADDIVSALRVLSQDLQYMSTDYNYAGVTTYSDISSQRLILSNRFSGVIDVMSLARAFNLDKAELLSATIGVNNFTFTHPERKRLAKLIYDNENVQLFTDAEYAALANIQGLLIDKDWFMIFDNEDYMDEQKNAQGMYFNHFYHVWKTFSTSPFNTAILLTTATPTITSVTVDPAEITVNKGTTANFKAIVEGENFPNTAVVWTVNSTSGSYIGSNGVLTVSHKETASSLTVTATSVADPTKSGTSTVTIE